jgi:hypothetical protein
MLLVRAAFGTLWHDHAKMIRPMRATEKQCFAMPPSRYTMAAH